MDNVFVLLGILNVVSGGFLLVGFTLYVSIQYCWGKVKDAHAMIELHEAIAFHREYHGNLQNGVLVCNACKAKEPSDAE